MTEAGVIDWAARYPWASHVERWAEEDWRLRFLQGVRQRDFYVARTRLRVRRRVARGHLVRLPGDRQPRWRGTYRALQKSPPPRFVCPRKDWPAGAWDDEPDLLIWRHAETGDPLMMWRNALGSWCGYVGLPPGHPLHGRELSRSSSELDAHGGITFSGSLEQSVRTRYLPESDRGRWWIGFDCAHFRDLIPGMEALRTTLPRVEEMDALKAQFKDFDAWKEVYPDVQDVRVMVEDLAERAGRVTLKTTEKEGDHAEATEHKD